VIVPIILCVGGFTALGAFISKSFIHVPGTEFTVRLLGACIGCLIGLWALIPVVNDEAKKRLWKLHKEGKLPRPWEFYEREHDIIHKPWFAIEQDVVDELKRGEIAKEDEKNA
jgi:hypothetical protein